MTRPMTPQDIKELVDLYTGLDGVDEYLRYLHAEYYRLTGEYL